MLGEVTTSFRAGEITGQLFFGIALLCGALKCWLISRRPTTNTKCALSLMFMLSGLCLASLAGTLARAADPSPAMTVIRGVLGLVLLILFVSAIVLGIIGLVEFSQNRAAYQQGRAQAIWTLTLAGLVGLAAIGGIINGARQDSGFARANGKSRPGEMLTFNDLNFRIRTPDRAWVSIDGSKLNKESAVTFVRRLPEAYFFVIAEKFGTRLDLTTERIAELGKLNLQTVAASYRLVSERPWTVHGLNGILIESDATVGPYALHYCHWYFATNGFAYQLVGYSRSESQRRVAKEISKMISDFELIDPHRIASQSGGFLTNFRSTAHGYTVLLTNSDWHPFANMEKNLPLAEFAASQGDSCFAVTPVNLEGLSIDQHALNAALLATIDISYPNERLTNRKRLDDAGRHGEQFDFAREMEGFHFHYRFQILQTNGHACLVAAWTQRQAVEEILSEAMSRVKFDSPGSPFKLLSKGDPVSNREQQARGFVFNQAGLYYSKQGDHEKALPLFRAAATANQSESIYTLNALNTWQHLDRPKEALEFFDTLPASLQASPKIRANQAFFQIRAGLYEQAQVNYRTLFANAYRDDAHFTEYINLLVDQAHYDTALAAVRDYLKVEDSLTARLLEAQIYRQKQDFPQALTLMKNLREKAPFNVQIATSLAETFLLAGQFTEAREISEELIRNNGASAAFQFLKGRSELGLKWFREAKVSFTEAARLAPANKDVRSYLDYVSGQLGEGDNTALMDPIEPVALPASLTNDIPKTVPPDYASNYGAYYARRITAVAHHPGKEYKTTDYLQARILDGSGVSAFSTVQMPFDPLAEQIYVNEVRIMDSEGKTLSTGNLANYYVLDDHSRPEASHKKILNIPMPGLRPGCKLAVTLTRRAFGHAEEFPFCAHVFASTLPVRESIFFLTGDIGQLKYHSSPAMVPEKIGGGLCWRVKDPLVARWEPLQRPAATFLPTLWVSSAESRWPVIVSNYLASISDSLKPDATLRSRAQKLVAHADNDDDRISLLSAYVQTNITYKAIEFGRRASVPNQPSTVLEHRYGDCKDHAVLLQQMLIAAGVPSELALVSHNGPVQKDDASLDQFDHMIVYVPGHGGRFLDCTSKGADVAHAIPAGLAGQNALILNREPRFVTIPNYPADASTVSIEEGMHLLDDADLAVEESLTLTGAHAAFMREYLLQIPETSRRTYFQNSEGMRDADLTDFKIESLDKLSEPLRLRFRYTLKKQLRHAGEQIRGVIRAGFSRSYLTTGPVNNRCSPFELSIPESIQAKISIDAPAGFHAERPANAPLQLDPRFLTGQGEAQSISNQLRLNVSCRQTTGVFQAADYDAYRQSLAQVMTFLEREVVFTSQGH